MPEINELLTNKINGKKNYIETILFKYAKHNFNQQLTLTKNYFFKCFFDHSFTHS
jgi:hypothetical protein